MLPKLTSVMDNTTHPLYHTVKSLISTFSVSGMENWGEVPKYKEGTINIEQEKQGPSKHSEQGSTAENNQGQGRWDTDDSYEKGIREGQKESKTRLWNRTWNTRHDSARLMYRQCKELYHNIPAWSHQAVQQHSIKIHPLNITSARCNIVLFKYINYRW